MTKRHADFELLCALAASGDLDSAEHAELSEHLAYCASCRERLLEMRRLEAQLILAQALKGPTRPVPRGMRQRFLTRAIREGIPLNSRPQGIGFHALGTVTALLMVLLLAAATLKAGPFRRAAAATEVVATPSVSPRPDLKATRQETVYGQLSDIQMQRPKIRMPPRRVPVHGTAPAVGLSAFESRQFHFTLLARNSAARGYPFSTAVQLPEIIPSLPYPNRMPRLTLDASSKVFRHIAPALLAYGATGAYSLPSNFDLDPPTGQSFRVLKVDFTTNGYRTMQIPGGGSQ